MAKAEVRPPLQPVFAITDAIRLDCRWPNCNRKSKALEARRSLCLAKYVVALVFFQEAHHKQLQRTRSDVAAVVPDLD